MNVKYRVEGAGRGRGGGGAAWTVGPMRWVGDPASGTRKMWEVCGGGVVAVIAALALGSRLTVIGDDEGNGDGDGVLF